MRKKKPYQPDSEVSHHLPWENLANLGHSRKSLLINVFIYLSEKMNVFMIQFYILYSLQNAATFTTLLNPVRESQGKLFQVRSSTEVM